MGLLRDIICPAPRPRIVAPPAPLPVSHGVGELRDLADELMVKSRALSAVTEADSPMPTTMAFDPRATEYLYAAGDPGVTHPGASGLTYGVIRQMSSIAQVAAIIAVRVNQIAEFAEPQADQFSLGSRVRLTDREKKPTKAEKGRAKLIMDTMQKAGGRHVRGGFEAWLKQVSRDSLTFDQGCSEIVDTRARRIARNTKRPRNGLLPAGFVPIDAETMRRAKPTPAEVTAGRYDPDSARYIQLVEHEIVRTVQEDQLMFGIRRPRSWLYSYGYGYPELEELISIVTSLVQAEVFNTAAFTTGIHSQALISLISAMNTDRFNDTRRQLMAMMYGPSNSRKMPVVQLNPELKERLEVHQLGTSNRDMEFSSWINWLMKVACSVFLIDPAEINFIFGTEGQTHTLNQAGPAERIKASRDRGLRPILRSIARWINEWIVWPFDPAFTFEFSGMDSLSPQEAQEQVIKAVRCYMKLDEGRAKLDLEPIGGKAGDMILDQTYSQTMLQMAQEDQEAGAEGPIPGLGPTPEVTQGEPGKPTGKTMPQAFDELTKGIARTIDRALSDGRLICPDDYKAGQAWLPTYGHETAKMVVQE